jgi:DNA-directed RNA polymerase subunit M/transcription elongation factor TFIIS
MALQFPVRESSLACPECGSGLCFVVANEKTGECAAACISCGYEEQGRVLERWENDPRC